MADEVDKQLPNTDMMEAAVQLLVDAAPRGWERLEFTMRNRESDLVLPPAWTIKVDAYVDGVRVSVRPPKAGLILIDMRRDQAANGQPIWQACSITVQAVGPNGGPFYEYSFEYPE